MLFMNQSLCSVFYISVTPSSTPSREVYPARIRDHTGKHLGKSGGGGGADEYETLEAFEQVRSLLWR